jgi:ABC-type bacteriocin/lantibiotic exporter with double-glycine peptidase domain
MLQLCARGVRHQAEPVAKRGSSHLPRRLGWAWVWASLRLRAWQLAALLALTIAAYAAGLVLPVLTQHAVDRIAEGTVSLDLLWLAAGAVAAIVVEAVFTSWRQRLVIRLGGFLSRRISRKAFLHLMRARLDVGKLPTGDVLNRFQQADKIPEFVFELFPQVVFDTGGAVVSVLLMFYYDALIGSATLLVTVISSVYLRRTLERMDTLADSHFTAYGERQNMLSESIVGIETIKLLALEGHRVARWTAATHKVVLTLQEQLDQLRRFTVGTEMITGGVSLIVLALGCYRILSHQLTFGELLALQLLAGRVVAPILSSGDFFRHYQDVKVALTELGRFMAEPREHAAIRPPVRELKDGGITARGLTLRYAPTSPPALDNVSFTLPPKGMFALVGRNGSGKSSLIRILLGLQRDFAGEVLIAGEDLRNYDPRWLRSRIGVANQDTTLFSDSIRQNIAGGFAGADTARIRSALALADAVGFVEATRDGLDTELEENGRNLSGGQRQRLAIARAVIRDPPMLLLDEPTASLDAEAALAIEQRIVAWGHDRLLILVTHHLAAARSADAILVLDQGRLVGFGTHAVLLGECASYTALWSDYVRSIEGEIRMTSEACPGPHPQSAGATRRGELSG